MILIIHGWQELSWIWADALFDHVRIRPPRTFQGWGESPLTIRKNTCAEARNPYARAAFRPKPQVVTSRDEMVVVECSIEVCLVSLPNQHSNNAPTESTVSATPSNPRTPASS